MTIENGSKSMLSKIKAYIDKKISSLNFDPGNNDNDFFYHTWGEQAANEIIIYAKGNTVDTLVAQYINTMGGTEITGEYNDSTKYTEYHCILPYDDPEMTENINVGSIKIKTIENDSQVYAATLIRPDVRQTDQLAPDYIAHLNINDQSRLDLLESAVATLQEEINNMKGGN